MKGAARVVRLVARRGSTLCVDRGAHRVEVGTPPALRREPCDRGLQHESSLEPLEHAVEPDVEDEEAAVDLELDETVPGESPQRLANRRPRDAELVRELRLTEPCA